MSEDKMREEFKKWWKDRQSADELFAPSDIAFFAWKACSAIKDAEKARLRTRESDLEANVSGLIEEIADLQRSVKELRKLLQDFIDNYEFGGEVDARITKALTNSEHHNSKVLEKMLLEARINALEEVNGLESWVIDRELADYKKELAELNKE